MKKGLFLWTVLLSISLTSFGQESKTRSTLQKEFIYKNFLQKQKTPLKITKKATMDSLFDVIETEWKKVAPDTLKKYKINMSLAEFEHFDSYCYLWLLTSITQDLNIVDLYGEDLINGYMLPALFKDFELIRKNPTLSNIKILDIGSFGNTLAIGSSSNYNKQTFLSVFKAFTDFNLLVKTLPKTDTAVIAYADGQLKNINRFYYDFNTRNSFYNQDFDKAYSYFLTGLSVNNYSPTRAVNFSKVLIEKYKSIDDLDKCYAILNSLAINTTSENLNRDTLFSQYLMVNQQQGKMMYNNLQQKLSVSAFKKANITIETPTNWETLNLIHMQDMKKVKYILLDFWYTTCGPCLAEIPELNKFYEKFKNRDDILFLSINTDYINGNNTISYIKSRIKDLAIKFPVVYDNEIKKLQKQLQINSYPSKIILNNKGEVLIKTDNSPINLETFEALIKEIK